MGFCSCFSPNQDRESENVKKWSPEEQAENLARLVSSRLEGEVAVTMRTLTNARVNVGAVDSPESHWAEPLTARLRSMDIAPALPHPKTAASDDPDRLDWTASRWALDAALTAESADAGWGAEWETGLLHAEATLRARLRRLGLDLNVMQGDGNCQFRSVAHSVYGSQELHGKVRAAAVARMERCPDQFRAFLGSDFDAYLSSMRQSGVWGDELTLRAISDALGITISVVIGATQMIRYIPEKYKQGATQEIFLTYISPVHYNAIQRIRSKPDYSVESLRRGSQILQAMHSFQRSHDT